MKHDGHMRCSVSYSLMDSTKRSQVIWDLVDSHLDYSWAIITDTFQSSYPVYKVITHILMVDALFIRPSLMFDLGQTCNRNL